MKILIVGAGIAGLTLAGLLSRRPRTHITLIERASSFTDLKGYAIGLYPLGSRVLHGLDLHKTFLQHSLPLTGYHIYDNAANLIKQFNWSKNSPFFQQTRCISRPNLINILRIPLVDHLAPDEESLYKNLQIHHTHKPHITLHMNTTIAKIDEKSDHVTVTFSDDSAHNFDLVVAADGINSSVRSIHFPTPKIFDTKWGIWAWWKPAENTADNNPIFENWGQGRFLGLYPTIRQTNLAVAGPNEQLLNKSISRKQRVENLITPMLHQYPHLLDSMPSDNEEMFYWHLRSNFSRKWHTGRVVLIGDAAASVLPTAGAGASTAMESAAVLADELLRVNKTDITRALMLYQKRSYKRVKSVYDNSRRIASLMTKTSPIYEKLRKFQLLTIPPSLLFRSLIRRWDTPI